MEQENTEQDKTVQSKSFIHVPAGPFYTIAATALVSGLAFWNSTNGDIKVIKERIETIKEDKASDRIKSDKMYLNYFELNDKIQQVQKAIDDLKNPQR